MAKYAVYVTVTGVKYVGEFEAASEHEAIEKAKAAKPKVRMCLDWDATEVKPVVLNRN